MKKEKKNKKIESEKVGNDANIKENQTMMEEKIKKRE